MTHFPPEELAALLEGAPNALLVTALPSDELLFLNAAAARLLGIDASQIPELLGKPLPNYHLYANERKDLVESLAEGVAVQDAEVCLKPFVGEPRWVLLSARPVPYGGRPIAITLLTDFHEQKLLRTELERTQEELRAANTELAAALDEVQRLARTDKLTGAGNRLCLEEELLREMERADRYGTPLSLILLDIDHFKQVNDRCGHAAGDMVLSKLAQVARDLIRIPDSLVRWGGEEFAVLTPQTDLQGAVALAEKLRAAIATIDFPSVGPVSASFGVAERQPTEKTEGWFHRVDRALYRAKGRGRNQVVAWKPGDSQPLATVRLEWSDEWNSGNALVDEEHRELLEMANSLFDDTLANAAPEQVLISLDRMLAHVVNHFADEEEVLRRVGYPELPEHKRLHKNLVKTALQLKERYLAGTLEVSALFAFLLERVVMGHLLAADTKFFPYTRGEMVAH